MLTSLRKQRDEAVKLVLNLQKDLNMRDKYEAAMKNNSRLAGETNYARDQANQQKKLLILKRTRSMQLQQRLNVLKASNAEAEKNCLFVNADHYPTGKHAAIFIISRTAEDAVSHINVYRKGDLNYFISVEQVLTFLRNIYEDRNEVSNARREYKTLKMRANQTFNEFFFHFRRFSSLLDFSLQFQIFDFQDKIVSRLRTVLINQQHTYTSLEKMRVFLQGLNDSQRYHLEDLVRIERKRFLSATSLAYIVSVKSEVVAVVVLFRSTSAVFVTFKSAAVATFHVHNHDSSMICFHCGELGHVKINCLNLNKSAVIRIREIIDESDEDMKEIPDQIDEAGNA
ncbi:MAG: hypothetical protein HETSPECPRED_003999 [Heterodermia speciosa]|uniref:CCHC-type domain-containing protein n=1 Tax=Heterodermia speciosa TaxID=116794 RepID=A0A8H3PIQ5_9LECA|nr:MAG: hypothetical protein HETSPECPRED_003999 [Heterodermia speciosa]